MPLEEVWNSEEEDRPLSSQTVRDLLRARTQVAAGNGISLEDVMR